MRIDSSKYWAFPLLLAAGTLVASGEDISWWDEIYTPARTALMRGTNTIMPFYGYYAQRLPASINRGGKLAASTYGTGVSWTRVAEDETLIMLTNMDYRRTDYRFSGNTGTLTPTGKAPFSHVDDLNLFNWTEYVFDKANGRAIAFLTSATFIASDSTAFSHGTHGAIGAGYKQYFSRTESLWVGLSAYYSRHRERWGVMPAIVLDFALRPDLNLRISNGAELTWDINARNEWILSAGINYASDCITVGNGESWYVQSAPLSLSARWNATENCFIAFGMKTIFWTDYRLWSGGHKTDSHFTVDPGVEFSVQAGIRF